MAKRRSKTANLLLKNDRPPIKPKEEVDKSLAEIQGRGAVPQPPAPASPTVQSQLPTVPVRQPSVAPNSVRQQPTPITPQYIQTRSQEIAPPPPPPPPKEKRVPLTTAITPENRALLEVAALNSDASVADMLNAALQYYFSNLVIIEDQAQVEMFKNIYARRAK